MSKDTKKPAPKPRDKEGPVERTPINVTLPPIDAEPEEIAQALFQRPPLKKPEKSGSRGSDHGDNSPTKA